MTRKNYEEWCKEYIEEKENVLMTTEEALEKAWKVFIVLVCTVPLSWTMGKAASYMKREGSMWEAVQQIGGKKQMHRMLGWLCGDLLCVCLDDWHWRQLHTPAALVGTVWV